MTTSAPSKPLLELAPWVAAGLDPEVIAELERELVVPHLRLEPGSWEWSGKEPRVGLLVVAGRIMRGLHLDEAPAHGLEVLGEGDVLRPWSFSGALDSVPSRVDWEVMSPAELAILDEPFVEAARRWPQLMINLIEQVLQQTRSLSYYLTARQVSRLEGRILLTLWHLADRWGKVTPEGVCLELPKLTHEAIARMVAARRPSVTTGIRKLHELGLVDQRSSGVWILHGDPVESLHMVKRRIPEPDGREAGPEAEKS